MTNIIKSTARFAQARSTSSSMLGAQLLLIPKGHSDTIVFIPKESHAELGEYISLIA